MAINPEEEDLFPYTGSQLLEKLNKVFPEQSAKLGMSQEEIWFKGGQRSVVNWLQELKDRENNQDEDV